MKRRFVCVLFFVCALVGASADTVPKPKLVVGIVIDQFRYDYLTRFRSDYTSGLARLLARGAVFTNARYEHMPTVTAVGHATFLTGAVPALSGIVGNEWYDRESGKQVTSVSDESVRLLGGEPKSGASPHRLLVSTLGDELKMAAGGRPRVIGVSLKDRSAVLPAGRAGDAAYWFDENTGNFVSSTYYFETLPPWVADYNRARPADRYLSREWRPLLPASANGNGATHVFRRMAAAAGAAFYKAFERSPFGNELVEEFAERAIEAEQLGQRGATDLLIVSFSSNDYVGHDLGPDSPEVHDISVRTDRLLGRLLEYLDHKVGLESVLIALTADHGVAPLPEAARQFRLPGGRLSKAEFFKGMEAALAERFGPGPWIAGFSGPAPYFNAALIRERKLAEEQVQQVAAAYAAAAPHIFRVYTRTQLLRGQAPDDWITRRVLNGFNSRRASDLFILVEPYWMFEEKGTSHGSIFSYDSHVPVIFMGSGIKPGRYHRQIMVNDIAPTLATLLEVETPSGSTGRPLEEVLPE